MSSQHSEYMRRLDLVVGPTYTVILHVVLVTVDLAVERVAHRAWAGGPDVPEHKIRERFRRRWELVTQAAELADTTTFYDT